MKYILKLRDYGFTDFFDEDSLAEARAAADEACVEWASGEEWGEEGAAVPVYYRISDEEGVVVSGSVLVPPNHAALIRRAGGDPSCDHQWSREGEDGVGENPGVWSLGGTTIEICSHCTRCGVSRKEVFFGPQRNPGEHDTVSYSVPCEE
jgi:hypothetical protein